MERIILNEKYFNELKLLDSSMSSYICLTKKGEIVKLFTPIYIKACYISNIDLEDKILNKGHYYISNEIVVPNAIIYNVNGEVCGYKTTRIMGRNLNEIEDNLSLSDKCDLNRFTMEHRILEEIVKKNKDIVFPDLCTCDNIIKSNNGRYKFIDYDGMQIGDYKAVQMSTTLDETRYDYSVSKYSKDDLFTKNLDKKSLILLYFLSTFNVNINMVGTINEFSKEKITLEEIFYDLGITDLELYDKVKRIFDDSVDNVYLEDTIERLAKDYKLQIEHVLPGGACIKRLIKR